MILVEAAGDVAIMRLDRETKRNALTPGMLSRLSSAIDTAASARAIVLSGVGAVFCAGFDLSLAREDDGAVADLLNGLSKAARALRSAPCPVVVSAHGAAIAGGCALLCAGDFAVTDDTAKIGYPAVRLGLSPAVSGPHLVAGVGVGPARALFLDPGLISGREALRIGLVGECVPSPAACEARAVQLAQSLAAKPRHALAYTKRWLNELDGSARDDRLDAALAASLAGVGSPELRERLAAAWSRA